METTIEYPGQCATDLVEEYCGGDNDLCELQEDTGLRTERCLIGERFGTLIESFDGNEETYKFFSPRISKDSMAYILKSSNLSLVIIVEYINSFGNISYLDYRVTLGGAKEKKFIKAVTALIGGEKDLCLAQEDGLDFGLNDGGGYAVYSDLAKGTRDAVSRSLLGTRLRTSRRTWRRASRK